jgi:hypothetical protein
LAFVIAGGSLVMTMAKSRDKIGVITGLVPVIHALLSFSEDEDVDGRVKPGHDESRSSLVLLAMTVPRQ